MAVHCTPSQLATPGVHLTSQPHEGLHATLRHDVAPVQEMSHLPLPHWRSRHELVPEHAILQLPVPVHVTPLRHEPVVLHATSQFQPAGHTTAPLQLVTAQSILHVWLGRSQLEHWAGHTFGLPSMALSVTGPSFFGASIVPPGYTQ